MEIIWIGMKMKITVVRNLGSYDTNDKNNDFKNVINDADNNDRNIDKDTTIRECWLPVLPVLPVLVASSPPMELKSNLVSGFILSF